MGMAKEEDEPRTPIDALATLAKIKVRKTSESVDGWAMQRRVLEALEAGGRERGGNANKCEQHERNGTFQEELE